MFTLLAEHRTTLNQLAALIEAEKGCAAEIYSEGSYADDKKQILDIASQKTGEEFIVLFIGGFACGKTSMINALIGEDLLSIGFLPETAIVCELHYGRQKRVTLYPKGDDAPFDLREVTTDEICKYVSLSTDDAINAMEQNDEGEYSYTRINAKFEKMVIYWPLDILKDGVVLVDSPGINDPYSNDYIVNDYLPKADAIVYVMDSQKAYTATDREALNTLNALGHKNIITAYTFYDNVERILRRQPERFRTFRKMLINHMMKHTDLGEVSIHFLDSMGGLDAKLEGDSEAWSKSGFKGFEDYLGQYLVEGKGTDQVNGIVNTIVNQADAMIRDAHILNNAAHNELSKTLDEAEARLQAARTEAQQRSKNYRQSLEERLPEVEQMVRTFLTEELPEHIDLEDFQPETSLPDGISKLYPMECRRKLRVIKKECEEEVLRRINFEFKVWANKMLSDYVATDKFTIVLPISLFAYINLEAFHIISRDDISSAKKIKFLVAKYAREFFRDVSTKEEVDNMVSDIMSNVKSYVEKTCAGAEKILHDEVENTERLIRRMVEDGKATLEEKTAQISQRNAAIDKLNNIKDQALRIGRDHGIRF